MSVILQDFTIKYGEAVAVDRLTTRFPAGSTGLLGVNGAGKSSLIRGLLGLVPIASGSAEVLGKSVSSETGAIRRVIGYMPEDDCLVPGLTGIGMVQYAGELSGMTRQDAMQRGHEILFLVGLGEARYRKVETFSRGMKQRVKLAQALVHDPELLFLDEPTSGMDPKGRQEMLDLIHDIAMRGRMSIVLATHILPDVERICRNVIMLHRGRLARHGEVESLKGSYSDSFSVRVIGDLSGFIAILEGKGCSVTSGSDTVLDVVLPKGENSRLIVEAAAGSGVQLRKMVSTIRTLEDVFVKTVGKDGNADI